MKAGIQVKPGPFGVRRVTMDSCPVIVYVDGPTGRQSFVSKKNKKPMDKHYVLSRYLKEVTEMVRAR
jgi:hypothetical protein